MPMLRRLRAQGFAVWPFDAFSMPLLVEIYPRVFTGNVVKSNPVARQHYLSLLGDLDRASQRRPRRASMRSTPRAQPWRWLARSS
jgi:hypothetical protein